MKKRVITNIFGVNYTIMGESSEEYIYMISKKVDEIMKEISKSNQRYNPTMIAVLSAVNLADMLYKTQEQLKDIENKLKEQNNKNKEKDKQIEEYELEFKRVKNTIDDLQGKLLANQIELLKIKKEFDDNKNNNSTKKR